MIDISAQGVTVTLSFGLGDDGGDTPPESSGGDIITLCENFSFEGAPVAAGPLAAAEARIDMNGRLISYSTRRPIRFVLTLLPGSEEDALLRRKLYASRSGKKREWRIKSAFVTYPSQEVFKYSDGRLTEGLPGLGVHQEGRQTTGQYTLVFADAKVVSDKHQWPEEKGRTLTT